MKGFRNSINFTGVNNSSVDVTNLERVDAKAGQTKADFDGITLIHGFGEESFIGGIL